MDSGSPEKPDPIDDSWPDILDRLEEDSELVKNELGEFLMRMIRAHPPAALKLVPVADREDELQNLLLHLMKDDLKKLCRLKNRGIPFRHWYALMAKNFFIDRWRKKTKNPGTEIPDGLDPRSRTRGTPALQEKEIHLREVFTAIHEPFSHLDAICRLIIRARLVDGLRPDRILELLRWAPHRKRVLYQKLQSCKDRLRQLMHHHGIDASIRDLR